MVAAWLGREGDPSAPIPNAPAPLPPQKKRKKHTHNAGMPTLFQPNPTGAIWIYPSVQLILSLNPSLVPVRPSSQASFTLASFWDGSLGHTCCFQSEGDLALHPPVERRNSSGASEDAAVPSKSQRRAPSGIRRRRRRLVSRLRDSRGLDGSGCQSVGVPLVSLQTHAKKGALRKQNAQ